LQRWQALRPGVLLPIASPDWESIFTYRARAEKTPWI
jgi:hypothetical protein